MTRCWVLASLLLVSQIAAYADDDLRLEVRRLVRQLDSPRLAQREAAEAALIQRGPAVLELLPSPNDRISAEVQQRLDRVRQQLQQAAADASTEASVISLDAKNLPLSTILRDFEKQSGNAIADYRRQFGQPTPDPLLTIHCDKMAFWPAFDRLLDQAGLTVYAYGKPWAVSVVSASGDKKTSRGQHASYSGPFRFEPVAVVAKRDLQAPSGGSLVVTLEVAWEPRLHVIKLLQRMADVHAVDEHGMPLPVADVVAQPEVTIRNGASAVKLELPLQLPPRDVHQIADLHGKIEATMPGKIETFRFDGLADAKNIERRIANVTVTLEDVRKTPQGCEVRMKTRFDDAGDALASHRQWIFGNPAFLESKDGKPIAFKTYETLAQGKNEVRLAYLFKTDRAIDELAFVYQTPGTIVTGSFEYRQKEIKLP